MRRVLVTGFPPFGGGHENISQMVIEQLESGLDRVALPILPGLSADGGVLKGFHRGNVEVEWAPYLLTCDEAGSRKTAEALLSDDLDAVLHLGLCNQCDVPRLETRAVNRLEMRIPDNSGRQESAAKIVEDGPAEISSTAPLNRFPLDSMPCSIELSGDAGRFVCNETLMRTLSAIGDNHLQDRLGRPLPCTFLHLPPSEILDVDVQLNLVRQVGAWLASRPRITVVCCVLEDIDGRFISCRRSPTESFPGMWEFPGGKVERGEDASTALVREIDEELGVDIEVVSHLVTHVHEMPGLEIELHAWHCRLESGVPRLCVHDRIRHLSLDELMDAEWIDADLPMIKSIVRGLS